MFGYLRLFSLVSFIAIAIIAMMAGLSIRSIATNDMRALVETNSKALVQSFSNTVWVPYRDQMISLNTTSEQLNAFRGAAGNFFQKLPVVQVNIYSFQGKVLYSTDLKMRGVSDSASVNQRIGAGRALTSLESDYNVVNSDGTVSSLSVVRSWIPIIGITSNAVEGTMEIVTDVSDQWNKIRLFQYVSTGGILLIFMTLIWVLILTSKKAETIIARQHETNLELAAAATAAQAENREKSLFLANISHELRTPLNAIIGFSEIIQNELLGEVANTKYSSYINDIHAAGVHLLSLINDILDFSKAEAGKLEIEIEEINASKMVTNCLRLVSPRAESGGVELINALPKEHIVLTTDGKKFKQVLLNLLSNAVKFTARGGEVSVSAWRNVSDDTISFEVRDSGIGIAPKDIARAMSPFNQVDNTLSRKYEGTGLGLPLSKKFVELLGGKFHIESELNRGTIIVFTLPRELKNSKARRTAPSAA